MAADKDLYIDQYESYSNTYELLDINNAHYPVDTTDYTVLAQLRDKYGSANVTTFSSNLVTGYLTFSLTPNQTGNLTATRYVYDVVLIDPSNTFVRIIEGFAFIKAGVSHV